MLRDTGDRLELAGAAGDGAAALDEAATGEAASGKDAAAPSQSKKLTCPLLRACVLNSASTHRLKIISCPLAVVHRSLTAHSLQISHTSPYDPKKKGNPKGGKPKGGKGEPKGGKGPKAGKPKGARASVG